MQLYQTEYGVVVEQKEVVKLEAEVEHTQINPTAAETMAASLNRGKGG